MGSELYWVCRCGAWTWASKGSCVGCDARPPKWVPGTRRPERKGQEGAGQRPPRKERSEERPRQPPAAPPRPPALAADGSGPTAALPLGAWVRQPAGGRRQAKARQRAASLAASGARSSGDDNEERPPSTTTVPDIDDLMADSGDSQHDDEGGTDPATRLASAKDCVLQLESMGEAARKAFPDFVERLAEARNHRDILLRERRAARPVRWRLVEAERLAKGKATAVDKTSAGLDELQLQLEKLQCRVAEQQLMLARSKREREQAEEAVAAVRNEIAREASPQRPEAGQRAASLAESAAAVARGIAQQVAALPTALATNNAEAALVAIQVQTDALLAAVLQAGEQGATVAPPGTSGGDAPPAAAAGMPDGAPSTPPTRQANYGNAKGTGVPGTAGAAATPQDLGATPNGNEAPPCEAAPEANYGNAKGTGVPGTAGAAATPQDLGATPNGHEAPPCEAAPGPTGMRSRSRSRSVGHDGSEPEGPLRPNGVSPGQRTLSAWVRRDRPPRSGASPSRG